MQPLQFRGQQTSQAGSQITLLGSSGLCHHLYSLPVRNQWQSVSEHAGLCSSTNYFIDSVTLSAYDFYLMRQLWLFPCKHLKSNHFQPAGYKNAGSRPDLPPELRQHLLETSEAEAQSLALTLIQMSQALSGDCCSLSRLTHLHFSDLLHCTMTPKEFQWLSSCPSLHLWPTESCASHMPAPSTGFANICVFQVLWPDGLGNSSGLSQK